MKYLYLTLIAMFCIVGMSAQNLPQHDNMEFLQMNVAVRNADEPYNGNTPSFVPVKRPCIGICNNALYLYGQFNEFILELVDNNISIYTVEVEANADIVALPDNMSGVYELYFYDEKFIYSCEIKLE